MVPDLSIIILNYNTKHHTIEAIQSVEKSYIPEVSKGTFEIIACDNGSTDGFLDELRAYKKKSKIKTLHIIDNKENIGFSKGNNRGVAYAKGRYLLFLNPDTLVYPKTLTAMIEFMDGHPDAGAATCKLVTQDGSIDINSHRGFPTPWNAFCHFFLKSDRWFPRSRLFAGYTQGWKGYDTTHEVDVIEGACMIVPRAVGEKFGWWDEDYFFNGDDIQFCYNVKKLGYKIYYISDYATLHIGGLSSGIKKTAQNITSSNIERKRMIQHMRFQAMRIFFRKNYAQNYPVFLTWFVMSGISLLEMLALAKLSRVKKQIKASL